MASGESSVFTAGLGFCIWQADARGPRRPPRKGSGSLWPPGTACPNLHVITPRPAGPDPQPPHFHTLPNTVTCHSGSGPWGAVLPSVPPHTPEGHLCPPPSGPPGDCHPLGISAPGGRARHLWMLLAALPSSPLQFQNKKPGSSESLLENGWLSLGFLRWPGPYTPVAQLCVLSQLRPSPLPPAGGVNTHDRGQRHLWEQKAFLLKTS